MRKEGGNHGRSGEEREAGVTSTFHGLKTSLNLTFSWDIQFHRKEQVAKVTG